MKFGTLSIDDVESITQVIKEPLVINTDFFDISWKMTKWCNYRCPYCYMRDSLTKQTPFETVLQIASKIDTLVPKTAKYINLHLIGGEVTYYDLIKVLQCIKTKINAIQIITNFSNTEEYYGKLINYILSIGAIPSICCSIHTTQIKDREALIKKLIKHKNYVTAKFVFTNSSFNDCLSYYEECKKNGIKTTVSVERNKTGTLQETTHFEPWQIKKLEEIANTHGGVEVSLKNGEKLRLSYNGLRTIMKEGGVDPDGFYCTAGVSNVRINDDGELYRFSCQMCNDKTMSLGNILEDNYKKPEYGVICRSERYRNGIKQRSFCTCLRKSISLFRTVPDWLQKEASKYPEEFAKLLPENYEK